MDKAYNPKDIESKWYRFWEENNFFSASAESKKPPYSIVMPPPNVTGILHMGHALVSTLQDILIRWKRMDGFEALWVPGTDHAGIATQSVVERNLMASGKRRDDFTRDEFVQIVWEWKEKSEKTIINQFKQLGCSCDWSRLRFTMDDGCNQAVRTLFKTLFNDGLIYRDNYLVNWDPITQTALADDEVEHEERIGSLWTFRYHLDDDSGFIRIATTRPETLLGDTAVAVSPKDPRYSHLVGRRVRLPITGRIIPIIADRHVDPEFGTGMVKITPAHDPNDYRIGLDHQLPFINVLTPDGRMNEAAGPFRGMTREDARKAVALEMEALGLLEKVEPHKMRVGISYRSKAIIEPYLSKQWFVKTGPFIESLKKAVEDEKVRIFPKSWEQTYFHWVNNLRDWCISRQLWWGHRIPVWHNKKNPEQMICYDGNDVPPEVQNEPDLWEQDPDVLDTWFSSALWPLSTLGWPKKTPDLKKFYPTSVLVTGHDILFFWVARMIMIDEYVSGHVPFYETFLHGLIYGKSYWRHTKDGGISYITGEEKKKYDLGQPTPKGVESKWEKLSKSKGNVIDPLELIQEYGTDAMRMTLCAIANQTPQIDLDRRLFEEFKNFANKVWNGARFVFMNLEDLSSHELENRLDSKFLQLEDYWILSRLNRVNVEINTYLNQYAFDRAALRAYDFYWKEFCAYYVEIAKPVLFRKILGPEARKNKQKILAIVLCNAIRLLHPMAPFITEELFQNLKAKFGVLLQKADADPYTQNTVEALSAEACIVAAYPRIINADDINNAVEEQFSSLEELIREIRNIRGEMNIPPQIANDLYLVGYNPLVHDNVHILNALIPLRNIHYNEPSEEGFMATGAACGLKVMIPLPQELAEKEKLRLAKERDKLYLTIERLRNQLENRDFLEKAKPELVEKQKDLLVESEKKLDSILKLLS